MSTSGSTGGNEKTPLIEQNHKNKPKCWKCWSWKSIGLIIAIVISCVILAGCIATGLFYYFTQNKHYETVNVNIGGKVPIKINYSDFDSHKFEGVKVSLANITNSSVTVYYHDGSCDDIKLRTTVLPSNSSYIHLNASIPYEVNYYNDTPIYALANTSISYSISVATNSSQQAGCVYLYLFNTASSYQLFLNRQNFTYYNKSESINTTIGTHKPRNLTILLNEDMFLYSGIVATVSSAINVTISGYRREYNVSLKESVSVDNTTEKKFCNSGPCWMGLKGGKHCILMMSPVNETIGVTSILDDMTDRELVYAMIGVVIFIGILFLISLTIHSCKKCIMKQLDRTKLPQELEAQQRNVEDSRNQSTFTGSGNGDQKEQSSYASSPQVPTDTERTIPNNNMKSISIDSSNLNTTC